jgi:hypothetical protein
VYTNRASNPYNEVVRLMPGRSLLYRRLWYIKKRNTKKINLLIRLLLVIILLCPLLFYAWNSVFAIIEGVTGTNPESLLKREIAQQLSDAFADLDYDSIIEEKKDESGRTASVLTNRAALSVIERGTEAKLKERLTEVVISKCPLFKINKISIKTVIDFSKDKESNAECKIGVSYSLSVSTKKVPIISWRDISGFIPVYEKVYISSR